MLEKRLAKLNMLNQPFPQLAGSGSSQWYNQLQSMTIQLADPTVKTYPRLIRPGGATRSAGRSLAPSE
jgi:hypothetical protein